MLNKKSLIANCREYNTIRFLKKHYDINFFKKIKDYAKANNYNDWDAVAGRVLFKDNGYINITLNNDDGNYEILEVFFTGRIWLGF